MWNNWLYLAGRGSGKTRAAAEELAWRAIRNPRTRWAILAPTFADARDTCAEGESGIVQILREYGMLKDYNRSIGEIFLTNRSRIKLFSAEEPERLRGPQFHGAWCDELAAYKYPEAWDQLQFGLRLGVHPQSLITTTPKPVKLVRDLTKRDSTVISRGSTFDNAKNLAPTALAELMLRYEGTRLGRQELHGEILEDTEGALWTLAMLDDSRVSEPPPLIRIVVGVDPAVTSGEESDETGIVAAGFTSDGHYYILEDASLKASPDVWARKAVELYKKWSADRIVAETNNGGDMVLLLMRQVDPTVPVSKVTATRGKAVRAEPVAALWEQQRGHIVGSWPKLEDQLVQWTPVSRESPDRMDAMVWSLTELMASGNALTSLSNLARICPACRMPTSRNAVICPRCATPLGD